MRPVPGKYHKDGNKSAYVQIDRVTQDKAYGRTFLKKISEVYDLNGGFLYGETNWVQVDMSQKFWIIDMHTWEKIYEL